MEPAILKGEVCPACNNKTLTLMEAQQEIPYFGLAFVYSMDCENPECNYHKSDLELEKNNGPVKIEFTIESEEDMKVRFIKSGDATVKIPRIVTIEPGPASNGYITNIEGILSRVKRIIEQQKENSDDSAEQKKCKNLLKKIQDVMWGREPLKITLEDPTGNSAILSDRAIVKKG